MKISILLLLVCAFFSFLSPAFGQTVIDRTIASVNLIRPGGSPELITQSLLTEKLEALNSIRAQAGMPPYSDNSESRREVMDIIITDILVRQAVERDRITISGAELNSQLMQQRRILEQQIQRPLSDPEFRQVVVQQTGVSWVDFEERMREQLRQQRLLQNYKGEFMANAQTAPSSEEINNFFRANRSEFTNPELVRISQIYVDTRNMTNSERQQATARAQTALRAIQSGTSFEDAAIQYSDDDATKYRGGDMGYLAHNNPQVVQALGQGFVDAVFALSVNSVSGIITSTRGLHIVKVTESHEARLLEINDQVAPNSQNTVREYIAARLAQENQQRIIQQALEELIAELRAQAEITIMDSNLG